MNRLSVCSFLIILTGSLLPLLSQESDKREFIRSVQDADIFFYYDQDYEKAAGMYARLHKSFPENSNIAAKLGICLLNIDGSEQEALSLLRSAAKNIVETDKEYVEYGDKAPLDTWLYMAVAYHRNDSLEKAISLYHEIREDLADADVFREDYIDNQIRDCSYAIEMKKKPLTILRESFTPWLEEYPDAVNPVLAKNDSVFIFTWKSEGRTRILCSYKQENGWGRPADITRQLGGHTRLYSNSVTADGKLLVLFLDDGGDGNLYCSERKDSVWSRIKNPGKNINTIYWESHGFITPDGQSLYISSNRPGGSGELDIWVAQRKTDGTWDLPVNLGEDINTPFNEDTPFYDPENNALLFSSAGHISMGGYDIFRSINRNGNWTNPVGMPFAYNTTAENLFFILNNNSPGFVTSLYNEDEGSRNIYAIVAVDPADEISTAEGTITLDDGMAVDRSKAAVRLNDARKGTFLRSISVGAGGKFNFELKPGDYQLLVSHPGYKTDTINLNLPLYFLSRYLAVNSTLIPMQVYEGALLAIRNILFAFDSYELDNEAKSDLEALKTILISHPELKVEVAGYTDSKGSSEYNSKLAGRRAQAVIDYLVSPSDPESRFVKTSFGESNFAAINTNPDGSDNPEGRKYNRRVTFGIIDPKTGIVLRQDTYTPEHLRPPSAMKYSIILKKSESKIPADYFSALDLSGMLFIRSIESDSVSLYALGVFYNRPDAVKYLGYVREKGFTDAFIVNHYDLNDEAKTLNKRNAVTIQASGTRVYTIQLKAARSPLNISQFSALKDVREIIGDDGYYRYVLGEFTDAEQAREAIKAVYAAGFTDAFIRELNKLTEEE